MAETAILTLTDFLLARIAEDAADAECLSKEIGRWIREKAMNGADGSQGSIALTAVFHTASDPNRVLAECEAKRRIVALHEVGESNPSYRGPVWPRATCERCVGFHADMDCENEVWPCETIRALALPYADHLDYREEEWRP